jgi:Ser/Thr protein kinase RdoA (MazF antagonist)
MKKLIEKILKQENIQHKTITKSTSGFTNEVFFVDDKYVIKVVAQRTKPEKLQKEIAFYKAAKLDNIPKYVSSGVCDGVDYLIISKLRGESLYSIWHKLDNDTRQNITLQIADILNDFHKQGYEFLQYKFVSKDWLAKWNRSFDINIDMLKKRGFDADFLQEFKENRLQEIMQEQTLGLVYNDAHFDNFLWDGKKVYLIDFDRVLYCSIDYEMLIISLMLNNPTKFASEEDEPNIDINHYQDILKVIKQRCKDMFDFEFYEDRVFIYQFIYNLGNAYEYDRNEWIREEIDKFKTYFGV